MEEDLENNSVLSLQNGVNENVLTNPDKNLEGLKPMSHSLTKQVNNMKRKEDKSQSNSKTMDKLDVSTLTENQDHSSRNISSKIYEGIENLDNYRINILL